MSYVLFSLFLMLLTPSVATAQTCTMRVPTGGQCGGSAFAQYTGSRMMCRNNTNRAWSDACCQKSFDRCVRVTNDFWHCVNPKPASSPPVAKPPTSPPSPPSWKTIALQCHNAYRARHRDTPPVAWNDSVADAAQKWSERCLFQHSNAPGLGENLFWSSDTRMTKESAAKQACDMWYAEIKDYDFSNPDFSYQTGHFTAQVWRSTSQLGCGIATCGSGTIVTCNYAKERGNVLGQFGTNVMPLK